MAKSQALAESHRSANLGWLRASVLGANDGIISTASLILGVASAHSSSQSILLTGLAGLVAGALSMASGEYVSVSSQADNERAELEREKEELASNNEFELEELAQIYVGRGVEPALARRVAQQLMSHDAIGSHARDELGITDLQRARPVQAALASAASFAVGAALPLALTLISPTGSLIPIVSLGSLLFLVLLGIFAARLGGSSAWKGALRVGFWGAFAMMVTTGIGSLFGTALG